MSKIGTAEWFILILIALFVDIVQILLDLIAIGAIVNRIIDIAFGFLLGIYLHWRGVNMVSPQRLFALIGTFIGEEIPILDIMPFWTLDVVYTWYTVRAQQHPERLSSKLLNVVNKASGRVETLNGIVRPYDDFNNGPINRYGVRRPMEKEPLNTDGVRAPSQKIQDGEGDE